MIGIVKVSPIACIKRLLKFFDTRTSRTSRMEGFLQGLHGLGPCGTCNLDKVQTKEGRGGPRGGISERGPIPPSSTMWRYHTLAQRQWLHSLMTVGKKLVSTYAFFRKVFTDYLQCKVRHNRGLRGVEREEDWSD